MISTVALGRVQPDPVAETLRTPYLTGLLVTAEVTAFVVGPAVGGLLLGVGGGAWSVTTAAVLGVVALPLLLGLHSGRVTVQVGQTGHGRLVTVLRSPGVVVAITVVAVVNFAESAASVGLLSLAHEHGEQATEVSVWPRPLWGSVRWRRR